MPLSGSHQRPTGAQPAHSQVSLRATLTHVPSTSQPQLTPVQPTTLAQLLGPDIATTSSSNTLSSTGRWVARDKVPVKRRRAARTAPAPTTSPAVSPQSGPPDTAADPAQQWTRYFEQLNTAQSLDDVLDLADGAFPALHPQAGMTHSPLPTAASSSQPAVEAQPATTVGADIANTNNSSHFVEGDEGGSTRAARRRGSVTASQADAVVDTLEAIGHWLQRSSGTATQPQQQRQAPSAVNRKANRTRQPRGVTYEQLVRCQDTVQRLLRTAMHLLQAQALPTKRLASLARAINTLAAASPATNSRQTASVTGFLALPAEVHTRQQRHPPGSSTPESDSVSNSQSMSAGPGRVQGSAAGVQGPRSALVLASVPTGFADAYGAAVRHALAHASSKALCYLLRAVSLDRCKRLLRASKHLSPMLMECAGRRAGDMSAEQLGVVVSCAAQLAWSPSEPWLQAVYSRFLLPEVHPSLSPSSACAVLHALGTLRTLPPAPVQALLMQCVERAMQPQQDIPAGGSGAEPQTEEEEEEEEAEEGGQQGPLTALQLSSALWAVARLGMNPRQQWLALYMATTYPLLTQVPTSFTGSQLANVMWALARLDWQPGQAWMEGYLGALEQRVAQMSPGELAMVAWALGTIKFKPNTDALHALAHAAADHVSHLDLRQLSMLFLSWSRLNFRPDGPTTALLLTRTTALLDTSFQPAATPRTPNDQKRPATTKKPVLSGDLTHQLVANLVYSVVHLGLHRECDGQLAGALERAAAACMPLFNVVELANVGRALPALAEVTQPAPPGPASSEEPEAKPTHASTRKRQPQSSNSSTRTAADAGWSMSAAASFSTAATGQLAVKQQPPQPTPVSQQLVRSFFTASLRHLDVLLGSSTARPQLQQSQQHRGGASATSATVTAATRGSAVDRDDPASSSSQQTAAPSEQQQQQQQQQRSKAVRNGKHKVDRPSQFAALLLAAVLVNSNRQPPAFWLEKYWKATGRSLLAWPREDVEVLCEAVRLMRPCPTPPLAWVQALAERRDLLLQEPKGVSKNLRRQMLLVLHSLKAAWQLRAAEEAREAAVANAVTQEQAQASS